MLFSQPLEGEISGQIIAENLNYYNGYIREEMAKGASEQEVLQNLGDPRLIAQTIIDTNGGEGDYSTVAYEEERYETSWHPMEEQEEEDDSGSTFWFHTSTPMKWYHKVLAVLIPIILIIAIVTIAIGFLQLVMYFAIPLIIVFICIYLYRMWRR